MTRSTATTLLEITTADGEGPCVKSAPLELMVAAVSEFGALFRKVSINAEPPF